MSNSESSSSGIGISTLVFLVFLTLKLAGIGEVANWSWWWVTSPLWIPILLILIVFGCVMVIALVKEL